ncbi:unnamed protein product, partial [Schistosoma margrebowiei]
MFLMVLPCQAGRLENGKIKNSNSRSEGEVVLLTVDGCDSSKVFPSDNQHLQPSHKEGNTLPRCGQPGSDISPYTRNSARDQVGHIQILPTPPNTPLISMTNPPHVSLSPHIARANDSSTWNAIPDLLKTRSKLH